MALPELQAMQIAYELLSPLDPNAQQRVMAWVSAALADNGGPVAIDDSAVPAEQAPALGDSVADTTGALAEAMTAAASPLTAAGPVPVAEPQPVTPPAVNQRPRRDRARPAGAPAAKAADAVTASNPATTAPIRRGDRPDGDQFLADLAAVGSFKALAEKYGKSIGTIGNWAHQLREQGSDIPVGRRRKP